MPVQKGYLPEQELMPAYSIRMVCLDGGCYKVNLHDNDLPWLVYTLGGEGKGEQIVDLVLNEQSKVQGNGRLQDQRCGPCILCLCVRYQKKHTAA